MILRHLPTISSWVMAAMLVAVLPFAPFPILIIGLAALGLRLGLIPSRLALYELFVVLLTLVSLPLIAATLWPTTPLSMVLVIPGLPWLAAALRGNAASIGEGQILASSRRLSVPLPGNRQMSPSLLALTAGLLIQTLIGFLIGQMALVGSALVLLGFLGGLVMVAYNRIPSRFLEVEVPTVRVLARDTVEVPVRVSSRAHTPVSIFLEEPNSWTTIVPKALTLDRADRQLRVTLTPALAGPSGVSSPATTVDPWGLTLVRQNVDLAHLRVIPRAAYAAWLARRFLELTRDGAGTSSTVSEAAQLGSVRRGLDYYGARPYEPGDVLRDIFWKHTVKLKQLIVKDRRGEHGEVVLITANLSAQDAEEADWLAYGLLMSALTLAREEIPLAYAAYTGTEVVAVTGPLAPRLAVMRALLLTENIQIAPAPRRVLEVASITRLRRRISRLMESETVPDARIARILSVEYQALQHRARTHPASDAIKKATSQIHPPAAILIVSPTREEVDALEATLDRLKRRGFHIVDLLFADGQVSDRNLTARKRIRAVGRAG